MSLFFSYKIRYAGLNQWLSKMILHHLQNSRSQRIIWLLEELNLQYDIEFYTLDGGRDHALKFPTLDLVDQGLSFTESSAIAEFICSRHKALSVDMNDGQYWSFCFYKNFADASLMPNLALKQIFQQIKKQTPLPVRPIPFAIQYAFNRAYLNPELNRQLGQVNEHLSQHTWLSGDTFTYADILLWFPLHAAQYAYPQFSEYKNLNRYLKQIGERSAFKNALSRGNWSTDQFKEYWHVTG